MLFVTDFADQAVILPLLVAVAAILAAYRRWRPALAWVLAVCGVLGTILLLKVLCYACSWLVPAFAPGRLDVQSPSGHVASATVVYAGLAALLGRSAWPRRVRLATSVLVAGAVAAIIGATRLVLGAHSASEVMIAAVIGTAGAAALAGVTAPLRDGTPGGGRAAMAVGVAVLVLLPLLHGLHLPAEAVIRNRLGERLRQWVATCQPAAETARLASARPDRR